MTPAPSPTSKHAVVTPADCAGLKLRVMTSDVYLKTFEALDAAPVSMQFSELFSALQQGAVDGQDNGLILSMDSKFNEVQGYYTDLGHVQDTSVIFISESFYQSLPEDLQQVVVQAAQEAVEKERQDYADKLDQYLEEMSKTMEVTILTDEQRAAFKEACSSVYDWYRSEYPEYDLDAIMADEQVALDCEWHPFTDAIHSKKYRAGEFELPQLYGGNIV